MIAAVLDTLILLTNAAVRQVLIDKSSDSDQ